MITLSEIWRRLQNTITTASVMESMASDGKMLVIVKYTDSEGLEHLSDWLPVATKNNSFMKVWMPPMVGEQVTVFRPLGESDKGIVFTSIHWKECKELEDSSETTAIVQFADGCQIKYDSTKKTLSIVGVANVEIDGNLIVSGIILPATPVTSKAGAYE